MGPPSEVSVSIEADRFLIDHQPTNLGSVAEGLLLNSRMVQAIVDIEEWPERFGYPDTGTWDPERNVDEFLQALPGYSAMGLDAFTVNLQGGNPVAAPATNSPSWRINAYMPDGTPKPEWLTRLARVLDAAEQERMVVIVGLFYFGQDHHLDNEEAVINAVDHMVDWLIDGGWRNVIIEIGNESDLNYDHAILQPGRVSELIGRVHTRSGGQLLVGTSFRGGVIPPSAVISASDLVLVHGNGISAPELREMVDRIRNLPAIVAQPKPIIFNEDSVEVDNFLAAVQAGVSWGYYDKGTNNYRDGFQAPPVDWSISTDAKRLFFDTVLRLTTP